MYIHILIMFFLFKIDCLYSNNSNFKKIKYNEELVISTNADNFVVGEKLLFNIQFKNCFLNSQSKIIYIQIINELNEIKHENKLRVSNSTASGDLSITSSFLTGNYKIIAYSNISLIEKKIFTKNIYIFNPTQILPDYCFNTENYIYKNNIIINKNSFLIKNKKNSYKQREDINLNLKYFDSVFKIQKANINIRKEDELIYYKNDTTNTLNYINRNYIDLKPENYGDIITGQLNTNNNSKTLENINICLSVPGENSITKITSTDSKGEFCFVLDEFIPNKNIIIQCIDEDKANYSITIDCELIKLENKYFFENPKFNQIWKETLKERFINAQIINSYNIYNLNLDSERIKLNKTFSQKVSKEYDLDAYTRFESIEETAVEIIDGFYITKKNNKIDFHISDNDINTELETPCLVLVDGQYIEDLKELLDHKAEIFKKISIIKGGYLFGTKVFNGIILFSTKEYNYESNLSGNFLIKPNILIPYKSTDFNKINITERIPDTRNQLYWGTFNTTENSLNFKTSDLKGIFKIVIEGINIKGQNFEHTEYFEVK